MSNGSITNLVSTTPSRFATIQPSQLPSMAVLESISTDAIVVARMKYFKQLWAQNDPPNAAQYDVDNLEFDPIVIQAEMAAFFELLVRDRVNQAARAVTLAFSMGTDVDAIGTRYPYGVPRIADASGNPIETDAAYKTRLWASPSVFSLNGPGQGTYESYVFWALSAPMFPGENLLKHAAVLTTSGSGVVTIPIIQDNSNPISLIDPLSKGSSYVTTDAGTPVPTPNQIAAVYQYIIAPDMARKGLTDVINVVAPRLTTTDINVRIWLFPGVDMPTLMGEAQTAVLALVQGIRWLGADLTLLSLNGALAQAGVYQVQILSPAADVIVDKGGVIKVNTVRLTYAGTGE